MEESWCENKLIGKDPDAGKDWRWEEKEITEDEMVGWHHRLDGHEFEQAPGAGDRQGSLACHSLWGCKESDMTEQLNWLRKLASRWSLCNQVLKKPNVCWMKTTPLICPYWTKRSATFSWFGMKLCPVEALHDKSSPLASSPSSSSPSLTFTEH